MSTYVLEQTGGQGRGHVHSMFATSLNVDVDRFLIHVDGPGSPLSCIGCTVSESTIEALLARVRVGDRATLEQGILTVFDEEGGIRIHLDALASRRLVLSPPISEACLAPLGERLKSLKLETLIGLKQDDRMSGAISILKRLDASDDEQAQAIRFLLGRGLGLTPSGDDVLMGYGIALHLRGCERRFVRVLGETLAQQTTDVSAAYLRAMMAGYANQGYCELAHAVRAGAAGQYGVLLAQLQDVGHTSGNDGLFGFSVGLAAA